MKFSESKPYLIFGSWNDDILLLVRRIKMIMQINNKTALWSHSYNVKILFMEEIKEKHILLLWIAFESKCWRRSNEYRWVLYNNIFLMSKLLSDCMLFIIILIRFEWAIFKKLFFVRLTKLIKCLVYEPWAL